ncbi:MAG: ATP-binding protein [Nitrospirota bacterium]
MDDEIIIARELEARLLNLGYEIAGIASSGQEAITLTEQTSPQLILMDIVLKGEMDGIDAAAEIRRRWHLPVIYLTAYTDPPTLQRARVTEPYGYIVKPFTERELHSNIEIALYKNKAETQLRQKMEECTRLTGELESANKELETFNSFSAHDLRAPLRAIDGFADILLSDYALELPPEAQRYLNLMPNRAKQMDQLLRDLLSFAHLSNQSILKQPVVMADLIRDTLSELRAEQEGRNIEIRISDLGVAEADPALLKQVFMNLLNNALKFTRHSESAVIEVGCEDSASEGEPVFFVKDNGIGFDLKYAPKIFQVFERLHGSSSEYEGTGVGLAIVQRVIERHGGRIWAEAAVDAGATFFFTLGNRAD